MPEKWQEAVSHWCRWNESVHNTRVVAEGRHGDMNQLLSRAKPIWVETESGISLNSSSNAESAILWNLYDEVQYIGSQFISTEVGLKEDSLHHPTLLSYWIHSVIPEITQDYNKNFSAEESRADIERSHVWLSSRVQRKKGKTRVIDSINWYRGTADSSNIEGTLQHISWPSSEQLIEQVEGGRPSQQKRIRLEAIVCALLKDKQGMKHKDITEIFGWSEAKSEISKPGSKATNTRQMSQTSANRVRLGRQILEESE
jgi:hypothetical protein